MSETLIQFSNLLFQIDFKTNQVVDPALNVIHEPNVMDRVCIASFSSNRLNKVRSLNSELCISMGPNEVLQTFLSSWNLYKEKLLVIVCKFQLSTTDKNSYKRFVDFCSLKRFKNYGLDY